jgi:voltage-gated potassium channel
MTASGDKPLRDLARPQNLIERRLTRFLHEPPSIRLAASVIVTATVLIVVVGGVLMRVLDHSEYGSVWLGMWWVLQTVTTVGYGDVLPNNLVGMLLTAAVMLWGIAFLAIVTAAITSVFVARAQRERVTGQEAETEAPIMARLDRVDEQLAAVAAQNKLLDERMAELLERTKPTP